MYTTSTEVEALIELIFLISTFLVTYFLLGLIGVFLPAKVRIRSDKQKNVVKLLANRRFRKMA